MDKESRCKFTVALYAFLAGTLLSGGIIAVWQHEAAAASLLFILTIIFLVCTYFTISDEIEVVEGEKDGK